MTEKKVNYPADVVLDIVTVYEAATDETSRQTAMEVSAEKYGKTVASIRSKLSFEGVYIPKAKVEGKTSTRVKKSEMVAQIADNANLENDSFFDSLEGANKAVLDYVQNLQVAAMVASFDELDGDFIEADESTS